MDRKILIILITTLTVGAIAQGVMYDVGFALDQYHEQLLRRSGRRTRTRREDQLKPLM